MKRARFRVGVEPVSVTKGAFIMSPGFCDISQESITVSLLHEAIEGVRKQGSTLNSPWGWDGLLWVPMRDPDSKCGGLHFNVTGF